MPLLASGVGYSAIGRVPVKDLEPKAPIAAYLTAYFDQERFARLLTLKIPLRVTHCSLAPNPAGHPPTIATIFCEPALPVHERAESYNWRAAILRFRNATKPRPTDDDIDLLAAALPRLFDLQHAHLVPANMPLHVLFGNLGVYTPADVEFDETAERESRVA